MGSMKFALDTGPEANSNSWLKYVRSAPSFEEQNLVACHLTGDQVSDLKTLFYLDLWSWLKKKNLICLSDAGLLASAVEKRPNWRAEEWSDTHHL